MQKENKMGKLSNAKKLVKAEKFSIEGMFANGMTIAEISKSLDRDKELVKGYIDSMTKDADKPRESEDVNNNGAAVMTEAIPQRIDAIRDNIPTRKHPAIHVINEQKKN